MAADSTPKGETEALWKAAHDARAEHNRLVYAKASRSACDSAWAVYTAALRAAEAGPPASPVPPTADSTESTPSERVGFFGDPHDELSQRMIAAFNRAAEAASGESTP